MPRRAPPPLPFGANNTKYKLEVQKGMGNMMTVNEKALKFFGKFNFVEMSLSSEKCVILPRVNAI